MKNQALFSSKDESKKLKSRLLQFLSGALKVNTLYKSYLAVVVILHLRAQIMSPFTKCHVPGTLI